MLIKIAEIMLTIMNAIMGIGLIGGMGIAMLIMSVVDGAPFGVLVGVIMIGTGIFTFGIGQHDLVHELKIFDEEEES